MYTCQANTNLLLGVGQHDINLEGWKVLTFKNLLFSYRLFQYDATLQRVLNYVSPYSWLVSIDGKWQISGLP